MVMSLLTYALCGFEAEDFAAVSLLVILAPLLRFCPGPLALIKTGAGIEFVGLWLARGIIGSPAE